MSNHPRRSIFPARFRAAVLVLAACCAGLGVAQAQATRADAEKDPVLRAMLTELDRSRNELQLKGFEKPFFLQYRIEEVDDFTARGEYGAPLGTQRTHQRVARVTVRVGDYKLDSSTSRGDGSLLLAALDNDPIALRSALWQATDMAYKAALSAYAHKQAELKQVQTPPQADDFSQEKPVIALETPLLLPPSLEEWSARVAQDSGIYRSEASLKATEQDVQYSSAGFHARATTTWLVNSEGTIVRKSKTEFQEALAVGTQADDGMHLDRSYATTGASLADLDTSADFHSHAVAILASLNDLRKAPLVEEEYHGPVLLSADSAADTLLELVAQPLSAVRPDLGTEARTKGAFASSYHARVLPESMDVIDDPSRKTFDGKHLLGAYQVDDEGVPAQTVKLVSDGRLENYLIGREPVRDFPRSNGHGRAAIAAAAHPAIGVLEVTARDGVPDQELERKLLALAKDRGLKSVYSVATMGPELTPRLLYKLTPDGKRELVRGATLDDLDQRALRSGVIATGQVPFVGNYFGEIPQTVLAPALLLDDITIRRANEKHDKLPFYPPPD